MLERIKKALAVCGCDAWEITEKTENRWEFYFIRHELDQHRAVKTHVYGVKLYKLIEDGKFLGGASGEIAPTATDGEIAKTLSSLVYQASLVRNPAYPLPDKKIDLPYRNGDVDVSEIAKSFIDAFASIPETDTRYLNSFEIFTSSVTRHTLNSNGVEYVCTYPSSAAEVVVNAKNGAHEIEIYRYLTSGKCDRERLASEIERAMKIAEDRLTSVPTPNLQCGDVVFSTSDAAEIYKYFVAKMNAGMIVRRMSDAEIGKPVCKDCRGDRVTVEALSSLENSSCDFPVDAEGRVISDRALIKDGVAASYWGDAQFSHYLGLTDSSSVYNFRVSGGSVSASEVRSGDYLEVVEFSSFEVDPTGGDIAGEIRLGYLHRGGKTVVVTGGSISGNMTVAAGEMTFSKETAQYDRYVIPAVTKLANLRITGAAD